MTCLACNPGDPDSNESSSESEDENKHDTGDGSDSDGEIVLGNGVASGVVESTRKAREERARVKKAARGKTTCRKANGGTFCNKAPNNRGWNSKKA